MFMASGDPPKAAFFRQDAIESPQLGRPPIFMGCCGARPWPKHISRRLLPVAAVAATGVYATSVRVTPHR
jgi:hypothetical protein